MKKIKYIETNQIFEVYGTNNNGFIVWNEEINEFICVPFSCAIPFNETINLEENKTNIVKNNLNGYFTNSNNLKNKNEETKIDNPIDFDYFDNMHLVNKCIHERSRREHYVSCAKSNFPVQILNCSKYCHYYQPRNKN